MSNFANNFLAGLESGRRRRFEDEAIERRNRLEQLSGDAFAAAPEQRAGILAEVARLDPQSAFAMQSTFDRQAAQAEAAQQKRLGNMAKLLSVAPAQARGDLYARMRPGLKAIGFDAPEQWDDSLLPVVQSLGGVQNGQGDGLSPRIRSINWAYEQGLINDEQRKQGLLVEMALAPGAVAGSISYVERYNPETGAMERVPTMNRGLTYTDGPLVGSAGAPNASAPQPANGLRITPTGQGALPEDPAVMAQIIEGIRSGREFSVSVPPGGAPAMSRPAPAASAASPADAAALRTLDAQTFGSATLGGALQSSPTTAQRAENEATVAAAATRARIDAEGEATGNFAQEGQLRKEFDDRIKGARDILGAYERVATAARSPTAAGDLSLIFAYMKMLDPGSVVREGEFANAQNAAGIDGRIRSLYNNIVSGQRLNAEQRADFLRQASALADNARQSISTNREYYRNLAGQYGFNPDRIAAPGARPPSPDDAAAEDDVSDLLQIYGEGS